MKNNSESIDKDDHRHRYGVIVHEDPATELRARRLWNELVHDMGQDVRFGATYQPAGEVKELLDFERASVTDIVIISVHDLARFLFTAAAWLDDWLATKSSLPRALFVLHDEKEDTRVIEFLQTISGFAGVTLFNRGCETCGPPVMGVEDDRQPAEGLALVA